MAQPPGDSSDMPKITAATLQTTLTDRLQAPYVEVEDISGGCGSAFEAQIVSPLFMGRTTLARHRLVNAALKDELVLIHAWSPKCFTPNEWERTQAQVADAKP
ncbi:MAG: hypothetical protein M1829_006843 [Trizodia sp. TS-e1964]|nr:MAG: hypothetical protein M1829_006843 [Trizodia sp. TS-e1964]